MKEVTMKVLKTKKELLEALKVAQLNNLNQPFSVIVSMPDLPDYEIITNSIKNLALKASYYDRAYDDQLRLKSNPEIKIVGYKYKETHLSFGEAIAVMQGGGRVAREGWNGKGMWLELQKPTDLSKMTLPYIFMKTADNNLVPWLASQTDMLAEDFMVLEVEDIVKK